MSDGIGAYGADGKLWTITDLDADEEIVGQFAPQSVVKTLSANIARVESVNQDTPFAQWIAGEASDITFTARLWAKDSTDRTVQDRLNRLELLCRRDPALNRPPICAFSWGSTDAVNKLCLIKSIGQTFDEIREDGQLRGVTLQVTLEEFAPIEFKATDPTVPEHHTRIRRAKRGDTYESIALDEYGDPLLGVLLRQLNPRTPTMLLADLNPLDPVHVLPEEYLRRFPIQPQFPAFRSGPRFAAAETRRRELIESRGEDRYTLSFRLATDGEFR